jgi:tetratricopeptide (TPR) repeat protein
MNPRILFTFIVLITLSARADDPASLMKQGDVYDAHMQTQKALDSYLAAEKLGPPSAELLHRIAKQYAELMPDTNSDEQKRALGEKALSYANRAVAADPHNARAQLSVAICYGRLAPLMDNKTKIAYSRYVKQYADKSLALDSTNDITYNVLGSWNYELAGLNPFLRGLAGMIYGKLPDASYDESVRDFKKALELNPNRLGNHIGLGRTYAAMGNTADAKRELQLGLSMPNQEKDDSFEKEKARESLSKL